MNRLAKAGAVVYDKSIADVHVSGHASAEELKLMLNLVQPVYFMPVHGETRHLAAHGRLAEAVGMYDDDIFLMGNGDVLEIDANHNARVSGRVKSGVVLVDGLKVGDAGQVILRDRQHMSQDGIATIVIAIDTQTGRPTGEPELVTRGIVFGPEGDAVLEEARQRIVKTLAKTAKEGATDVAVIKNAVRESFSQFMWERTRRRPMIIPVVMEV